MAYRIRELREKKKLTQEQLAQKSGVSRSTIIQLENNDEHEAMVGTLKSLAAALEVPVSKLFTQNV
jgi:transcriptional regulator with XRE-family HTH domain